MPEAFRAGRTEMSRQVWCYFPSCSVQRLPARPDKRGQPPITAQLKSDRCYSFLVKKCMREGVIIFLPQIKAWTGLITVRLSLMALSFLISSVTVRRRLHDANLSSLHRGRRLAWSRSTVVSSFLFTACFKPDVVKDQQVSLRSSA